MDDAADQIIALYRRHAATWAARRSVDLFEKPWLDAFWQALPSSPRILDLGCGMGHPIAAYFMNLGATVTGVDTSTALLDMARKTLPDGTWIQSDMRDLDLDQRFDGILAWNSSFHLTPQHQRTLFPVFRKHAAPGAALMFTSGPSHGPRIGRLEGAPLYHASLDPDEYRALCTEHGFSVLAHTAEDPACRQHTVWLAQCRNIGQKRT